MAIMFAQKNHASLINFSNLTVETVKLPEEWIFKLVDSNVDRKLSNTSYNEINNYNFEHVKIENLRVRQALSASKNQLGELLNRSHESLRALGVSNEQVDKLVTRLQQTAGVLGARMMGGGFGGMILVLVDDESILPDEPVVISAGAPVFDEFS